MYPTQIYLPSLISALNSRHRVPYIQSEATSTTIGLAAVGAYGRGIIVEESFWSQGMSPLGIETKAGPILVRLSHLIDRIIKSQLDHANTYRGQS